MIPSKYTFCDQSHLNLFAPQPAPTTHLLTCSKCQSRNQAYATFCHSCGCSIEPPLREDPRNNTITVGGKSTAQVTLNLMIKTFCPKTLKFFLKLWKVLLTLGSNPEKNKVDVCFLNLLKCNQSWHVATWLHQCSKCKVCILKLYHVVSPYLLNSFFVMLWDHYFKLMVLFLPFGWIDHSN